MAGNTKLIGFTPSGDVQLERWGEVATVVVSQDSLRSLREACFDDLPKRPPRREEHLSGVAVSYSKQLGIINMEMAPDQATELMGILTTCEVKPFPTVVARLEKCVKEHLDYTDIGEPGVED